MSFLIASFFWFLGLFLTSYTLIPTIIILRFGISYTKELEGKGMLVKANKIIKRYLVSIVIFIVVFIAVVLILYLTTEHGFKGFIGGAFSSLVFGIWKTGKNQDNIKDYLQVNSLYFKVNI